MTDFFERIKNNKKHMFLCTAALLHPIFYRGAELADSGQHLSNFS